MTSSAVQAIARAAIPLSTPGRDLDAVVDFLRNAKIVLLGESTHGSSEFYRIRAAISERLIQEHGFDAVVVEGDWPDAYRVNRYVRWTGPDPDGVGALSDFKRFPAWMWRNHEVLNFIEWLRYFNEARNPSQQAGFYGLDLYSLYASMAAVLLYLDEVNPEASALARKRYECFGGLGGDPEAYGYSAMLGMSGSCEKAAIDQLLDLQKQRYEHIRQDGLVEADEQFCAEQNARVVCNGETYYRAMFGPLDKTWNLRDSHMFQSLSELRSYLSSTRGREAKVIVWAHNSHVGDARATSMRQHGEINLGQLLRQAYGGSVKSIGFSTSTGNVCAAEFWNGPLLFQRLNLPIGESYEALMSSININQFFLPFHPNSEVVEHLSKPRFQRAIGVIYVPHNEFYSHYTTATLTQQFDALIHVERTSGVIPFEDVGSAGRELPETFPSGV